MAAAQREQVVLQEVANAIDRIRDERTRTVLKLRCEGVTYREIAARYGVSIERIRQLAKVGWKKVRMQVLPQRDYFDPQRKVEQDCLDALARDAGWKV